MPLAGLGEVPKTAAAIALREVADTQKVQLAGALSGVNTGSGRFAIQGLQLRRSKTTPPPTLLDAVDTKVVNVTPSGSGDNIAYSFGLYTPEVHADGVFSIGSVQILTHPFENKIFSLKENNAYTSVKRIESIATQLGEGWDYSILKASVPSMKNGDKDATLHAELWTDYASASSTDYMVGGWWLLVPNNPAGDYTFGAFSKGEKYYHRSGTGSVKAAVEGTATYKGNAAGLHTSSEESRVSIQRLLGKVTLNADFGDDQAMGTISGTIDDLTLDGESARGQLLLPSVTFHNTRFTIIPIRATDNILNPKSNVGNIEGINYDGDWSGSFQGDSTGTDQPTSIVGVVGGSGDGNSFVASFGAKKVEDE